MNYAKLKDEMLLALAKRHDIMTCYREGIADLMIEVVKKQIEAEPKR